jgi:hypothetical protein
MRSGTVTPRRAGEGLLLNPQIDVWYESGGEHAQLYDASWEIFVTEAGNKIESELAMPCIYNNKTSALRGGFSPRGCEDAGYCEEYIFLKSRKYKKVTYDEIRPPTQEEFDSIFRKLYTTTPPKIVSQSRKSWDVLDNYTEVLFYKERKL